MKNNILLSSILAFLIILISSCNSCNTIIPQQFLLNEPSTKVEANSPLAIHGTHAMAGVYAYSFNNEYKYYFIRCYELKGGKWEDIQKIDLEYSPKSIAIYGNYAVVGYGTNDSCKVNVYLFRNDKWIFMQSLYPSDSNEVFDAKFGESVDIYQDYIIAGNPNKSNSAAVKGYAYIFKRINSEWNQVAKITTTNKNAISWFGIQVQIDENVCVIKSQTNNKVNNYSGYLKTNYQLHIFKAENDAVWNETAIIDAGTDTISPYFAEDFDLYGQNLIVSAYNMSSVMDTTSRFSTYFYYAPKSTKYLLNAKYVNHLQGTDVAVNSKTGFVSNSFFAKNTIQLYSYENGSFVKKHTIVQPNNIEVLPEIKCSNDYIIYHGKDESKNSSYIYFFKL